MVVKSLNTHTQLLGLGYTARLLLLHMGFTRRRVCSQRNQHAAPPLQGNCLPFTRGAWRSEAQAGFTAAAEQAGGRGQRIYSCLRSPGALGCGCSAVAAALVAAPKGLSGHQQQERHRHTSCWGLTVVRAPCEGFGAATRLI